VCDSHLSKVNIIILYFSGIELSLLNKLTLMSYYTGPMG